MSQTHRYTFRNHRGTKQPEINTSDKILFYRNYGDNNIKIVVSQDKMEDVNSNNCGRGECGVALGNMNKMGWEKMSIMS